MSALKLVFLRRAGIQLEQIHELMNVPRGPSHEKLPAEPAAELADRQAEGVAFICLKLRPVIYNLRTYIIFPQHRGTTSYMK